VNILIGCGDPYSGRCDISFLENSFFLREISSLSMLHIVYISVVKATDFSSALVDQVHLGQLGC
jgi:hypothetical protein